MYVEVKYKAETVRLYVGPGEPVWQLAEKAIRVMGGALPENKTWALAHEHHPGEIIDPSTYATPNEHYVLVEV